MAYMAFQEYTHLLVMPAANRNLMVVVRQERLGLHDVRHIARRLGGALQHLHANGMVHCDLKPLNAVRFADAGAAGAATWRIIDLDAAVQIGCPAGVKISSGYLPPEMVYIDPATGEAHLKVPSARDVPDDAGVVLASPAFDLWSFGVLIFLLFTGQDLFALDIADNFSSPQACRLPAHHKGAALLCLVVLVCYAETHLERSR
ncbi:hypothetical protein CYMTET_26049 [Cymbomonas tetramitiformis]|uniref:Protein kinase domain-containing protein n=1 Tax=Cymbomonas tetramitiformis TaxID=36881 RepID=A0AAE0KYM0_9CHLO|nr:hypothetical protein CYMTET_26049 [Cymbomonas tetramitiformis]